jgi:hypothetical protein
MKRWVVTPYEERLLDCLMSEYRTARQARDRAKASLARFNDHSPVYREQLEVARETIRLTTELVGIIRTQR